MVLRFIFLSCFICVSSFAATRNYRPVKGLEPKESRVEEEGTKEITIKRREVVTRKNTIQNPSNRQPVVQRNHVLDPCETILMCRYMSFSFSNQTQTSFSNDIKPDRSLGVAIPIADRRFGGDIFFGGKPFNTNHIDIAFGVSYDMAYFDAKNKEETLEYGIHSIAPSIRFMYDAFPEDALSFYIGGEVGFAIVDLIQGLNYSVQYSYKVTGLTQVGYKFGDKNTFEVLLGYKIFHTPALNFNLASESVKTKFEGQALQAGLKIKF